jgi:hypothetical protein
MITVTVVIITVVNVMIQAISDDFNSHCVLKYSLMQVCMTGTELMLKLMIMLI